MVSEKRCTSSCGDSDYDSDRHTHREGCRFAGRQFPKFTQAQMDTAIAAALADQREKDAKIAETYSGGDNRKYIMSAIAAAIRAEGEGK